MQDTLYIFFAQYLLFVSMFIGVVYFLRQSFADKKRIVLLSVLSSILTLIGASIASHTFYNPRPFIEGSFTPLISHGNNNGFPSDHTLAAAFVAFVLFHFNKRVGFILLALAIVVGLGRIYVGVHHTIDVVAAILIAYLGVFAGAILLRRLTSL